VPSENKIALAERFPVCGDAACGWIDAGFFVKHLIWALFTMRLEAQKSVICEHHFSVAVWEMFESC
jgi:hypothetical protein